MKVLFTLVLVVGGLVLYETETNFPAHATVGHRAIPGLIYIGLLVLVAAVAKSRENGRRGRGMRSSRGGSSSYPFR